MKLFQPKTPRLAFQWVSQWAGNLSGQRFATKQPERSFGVFDFRGNRLTRVHAARWLSLLLCLCLVNGWLTPAQTPGRSSGQRKKETTPKPAAVPACEPIQLAALENTLRDFAQLGTATAEARATRNRLQGVIAQQVKSCKLAFPLTPELEQQFKPLNLPAALLTLLRANYIGNFCPPVPPGEKLSVAAIVMLLQAGVRSTCLSNFVKQRGVDFVLTPDSETELRTNGASGALLESLRQQAQVKLAAVPAAVPPLPEPRSELVRLEPPPANVPLTAGLILHLQLTKDLNTKQSRSGESFLFEVRAPNELSGAKVQAILAKVKKSSFWSEEIELELEFTEFMARDGQRIPFKAQLQQIVLPNRTNFALESKGRIRSRKDFVWPSGTEAELLVKSAGGKSGKKAKEKKADKLK